MYSSQTSSFTDSWEAPCDWREASTYNYYYEVELGPDAEVYEATP